MGPDFEKGDGRLRLASNNASPAQSRGRGAPGGMLTQPPHATPLAAVLFPARGATSYFIFSSSSKSVLNLFRTLKCFSEVKKYFSFSEVKKKEKLLTTQDSLESSRRGNIS